MKAVRVLVMLAGIVVLMIWSAAVFAQKDAPTPPKYDVATETTLKGTVEEVKEVESAKGTPAIHLMLKAGGELLEVYLCPNAFLQEMEMKFAKGDQIDVTGSKVKVDGADVLLAREITKGTDTLVLRDKKGVPVWTPVKRG